MKKVFLSLYLIATTTVVVCQKPPMIDSTDIQNIGAVVFDAATDGGTKQLIKDVPNVVTGGVLTALLAFVGRWFEKRRLRKAGKLKDGK